MSEPVQPSGIDLVAPFGVSNLSQLSASELDQLVGGLEPYGDKGLILISTDVGGLPQVPDANGTDKWQRYLWIRVTATDAILYVWNPNTASDGTYQKWVQIVTASLSDNTLNGSKLINNSVSSGKIISLDWGKIINTPANSGDIGGVYPALVINALAVTSAKIAAGAVIAGKIGPGAVSFGNLDTALQTKIASPAGMIAMFATPDPKASPPAGWLFCDGSEVPIADYPDLNTAIYVGDTLCVDTQVLYGYTTDGAGNRTVGGTHIKLPDLRGQFLRGWNPENSGDDATRKWASTQAGQNVAHTHPIGNYVVAIAGTSMGGSGAYQALGGASTQSSGGTEARPKNIVAAYCIKY